MGHSQYGAPALENFFFGLGYCARRLIQREPWIEPSGTARTAEAVAALRREGVEAYRFDGAEPEPGLEQALGRAEAIVVSIPPRDGRRRDARALRGRDRRRAGACGASLYYSTIGVYGDHGGAWVDETSATRTRTARGLARLEDEARWTAAARARGAEADILRLPASTGQAAMRSSICARGEARRDRQAGPSVQPRPCRRHRRALAPRRSRAALRARSGTSPTTSRPRRRRSSPMRRRCSASSRRPRSLSTRRGFRRWRGSSTPTTSGSRSPRPKPLLGFEPAYPTYREGLKALAEAGEGRGA